MIKGDAIKDFWIKKITVKLYFQLISALNEAHKCGILHRDVKADNCLLDDKLNLKLCDFGIARDKNNTEEQTLRVGTYFYMSPELQGIIKSDFNYQPDVWAAGVLLYQLMHGEFPFDKDDKTFKLND